ncbi:hypothetical protein HYW82_01385 [Candidatus Peregrinibacteria bacterium]|nr:hypothetical protein [Candidatus Peregrinibacteria bacterium]
MFITLTIDTSQQKKANRFRFHKKNFNPATGWKKQINARKRSLWQRFKAWRRSLKEYGGRYKFGGQIAMF